MQNIYHDNLISRQQGLGDMSSIELLQSSNPFWLLILNI